jgi:predicted ATP-dependent endonuclease of OLD family
VRRIVSLMAALSEVDPDAGHTYILFDEPENSLHADSQHMLRRVLEDLAAHPTVQVVYATHSPSMINTMRPHAVRLLHRVSTDGRACTRIDNRPYAENYRAVRASLGITPADSLLYAPLAVIVEGITEVVALPIALERFQKQGIEGFGDREELLSQTGFIEGGGDSFPYLCRLAKS